MLIPFAQIDAFASAPFEGNQACVMPLETWLADTLLQKIAAENNVAETAFLVSVSPDIWQLRWFTPSVEVPLCGHATLAAAHYLFQHTAQSADQLTFKTRQSGDLLVRRSHQDHLEMNFPASELTSIEAEQAIIDALGAQPLQAYAGSFYAALFESADEILSLQPDYQALASLGIQKGGWGRGNFGCFALGGDKTDVTSRFFAPGSGIDEDPATGSWHCMLTPILHQLTGRSDFSCYQAYPGRGAFIQTRLAGDRVILKGQSVTVIEGTFRL